MPVPTDIRILLVEDAGIMRKMEKKTLDSLGFKNILEAEDGTQAVDVLQREGPVDLIISDWNMPNMDGYELLQWIRQHEEYGDIPFMMATGRGEKKEMAKAAEAGVSSFISKPFNADELHEKIEEAFGIEKEEEEVDTEPKITESGRVRLKVAHIQITDHLVLGVLKHLINSGKFQPEHFELETVCMPSWNPVAQALEKGTIDGGCVLAPIAMDLFGYGVDLRLILFAHKNGSIFVRNKEGGEYKPPFQNFFLGKTFYIPHFMSIHHLLADMFFEGIGLNPGVPGTENVNVNFEVVPPVKMPELLGQNADACGYLVAEPLGTKAIASGLAELQFFSSELWENHPCCVVTMQKSVIDDYPDAVQEFTSMLVEAGKFIERKPGMAAEIGVNFLDPEKKLGLKVPLLKNVLMEPKGITTGDLFPVKQDLDRIQRHMHDKMGIGHLIDLDEFVDLRFATQACGAQSARKAPSKLRESHELALDILQRSSGLDEHAAAKALINKEGKYLIFTLAEQQFGIDILKIREIIRMQNVRTVPRSPNFVKGIINLRGQVVPVIDLRVRFGFPAVEEDSKNRIIVLEIETKGELVPMGIVVDAVSEVVDIHAKDIDEAPSYGLSANTEYILALAKLGAQVNILLDIDQVLNMQEAEAIGDFFHQVVEDVASS